MPSKARKTERIVKKKSPKKSFKKSEKSEESEESDLCAICFFKMEEDQDIKILNCYPERGIHHKFHRPCIDGWINTKINNHQVPTCPTCIRAIEQDLPEPAPAPLFDPPPAHPRADRIDRDIAVVELQELQNNRQSMPFLGVIVLYRDGGKRLNHLKTYLNTELGLRLHSTLNNLKEAILRRPDELAIQCPLLSQPRAGVFLNNLVSSQRQASFVIEKMYFGTPAGINSVFIASDYPGRIHSDMPYGTDHQFEDYNYADNDATLQTIYHEYREKAKDILDTGRNNVYKTRINGQDVEFSPLKDVFNQLIEYNIGRRVNFASVNYFYNHSNPDIPREFRPQPYWPQQGIWPGIETEEVLKKSTKIPLAWMIVEVGCGTFRGGKTRRNKSRRKQNK